MTYCAKVAAVVLLTATGTFADSIVSTDGSFSSLSSAGFSSGQTNPAPYAPGTPFWNNYSYDSSTGGSHDTNIGYLLTNSGGFTGTSSVLGADSVANGLFAAGGSDPSDFNLVQDGTAYNINILFARSSENRGALGTTFGWYDVDDTNDLHPIFSDVTNTNSPLAEQAFAPTAAQYAFYASVCYAVSGDVCTSTETYFSASPNRGDFGSLGWNHFALFNLNSSTENYVIGFTGQNGLYAEGLGDFNDLVVELSDPRGGGSVVQSIAAPEPATLGFVGLGLLGLGLVRRRFPRKGA